MKVLKHLLKNNYEKKKLQQQLDLIRNSDYFDANYYLQQNQDVAAAGIDPAEHFLKFGGFEGRQPSERFDPEFYLQKYEDVAESGMNPLLHFIQSGAEENREPLSASDVNKTEVAVDNEQIDCGLQLLQLLLLQGNYADFDALMAQLQLNQLTDQPNHALALQQLQLERWLAAGEATACASWLKKHQSHDFYWFYQAKLQLFAGDYQAALKAAQSFLYRQPIVDEGFYLLADAAVGLNEPEQAWQSVNQSIAHTNRARSFQHLAQLVQTPSSLDGYLTTLRQWCLKKPNAKYEPDITVATALACCQAGNLALAKQVLHDCIAFHQSRKHGFAQLRQLLVSFSEHPHLPLWPQPFQQLPVAKALDCQRRMQLALHELYRLTEQHSQPPFLLLHSLQAVLLGTGFDPERLLTLGIAPEADRVALVQLLHSSSSFRVVEHNDQQLRLQHSNGIVVMLYYHQQQDNGWQFCDHGVRWLSPAVQVQAHPLAEGFVFIPAAAGEYLAHFYEDWAQPKLDFVVQSRNRKLVNQDQYSIYCYRRLLTALMAEDGQTEVLMLRELSHYESKHSYQQLVGSNYCIPTLQKIKADGIELVLYVTGLEKVAYQGNMWIPVLEQLAVKSAIVIREKQTAQDLVKTRLPVYFMNTMRELELLDQAGVKTILYPANTQKNVQTLRFHSMNHFFINHGDSDKVVNQSKFLMAYDKLLVAGPLAEQRIRCAGLPVREGQIEHVGRPQVELMLERTDGVCRSIKTILYAPTWEGFVEEANYSSVNELGYAMLQQLLQHGGYKILFKPHPYTGFNQAGDCGLYLERMRDLATQYPQFELVDIDSGIHPWMNASDLLITDISSVLNDYLHTLKPIILMNPKGFSQQELAGQFPSSAAAYPFNREANVLSLLQQIQQTDDKREARIQTCKLALGDFPEGALQRFSQVVTRSLSLKSR
ncbi:CDP-glycerol glycerophosphotransferase family protein [Alkalimonas amylolytica]|uniref:CDP-glycerol glycerophosphotransferase, TagB/SpsB family n=1 Tax=Alkalimonas amylolytica TaxID=152573 RepID=A0A1H4A237_ALKAM|nr:CDP-glycerol glycerophosphotransferase family protein [Alkalimonas amylolytica]SEA29977.1 CDP-glycerol glycerophosphotransferase, TagB/SpsB family [Alkalimonas amylolytica]